MQLNTIFEQVEPSGGQLGMSLSLVLKCLEPCCSMIGDDDDNDRPVLKEMQVTLFVGNWTEKVAPKAMRHTGLDRQADPYNRKPKRGL